ncbi:syntaxin-5 [Nasonia vitripennis]|uniref:t-SNARE coiled-coil homology domain-containing protein n=1 Tax=Nasonia vitripennis TaxID=7425 RepID=A0A7M7G412_NASVI|nr:syntaxin-5 [Nasonia vitripennis]
MSARRRRVGAEAEQTSSFYKNGTAQLYDNEDNLLGSQQELQIAPTMTSRDRTQEFGNAIQMLQSKNISRAAVSRSPRQAKHLQSYSNFMLIAQNIGKNIASTYAKLEKLALLAKKKSIFDDRQSEIEELTSIIGADLGSLNQQIAKLQVLGKKQREMFSSSKGHHIASHSTSVAVALQSKLVSMSTHFKSVLDLRKEKMREEKSRREQFSHGHVSAMLPSSVVSGKQSSLLLQEQDNSASVSIDLEPAMGQLSMQRAVYDDDTDSYLQSRADTMQNIESTIVELGGIFQQLAHMVKEQEEMVERIDSNIEDAEINVSAAHTEILKYFQSVTNNRWLMIKIFGVLIFFFIFFVVFMA